MVHQESRLAMKQVYSVLTAAITNVVSSSLADRGGLET